MVLRPAKKLVCHASRRVVLASHPVEHPLTVEHGPELGGGAELLAELASTGVGPPGFRRCPALRCHQCHTQRHLEVQFSPRAGDLGQARKQAQPIPQLRQRFRHRRARDGWLSRPQPIVDRRFDQSGLHVMVGQKFGLYLHLLRKMLLKRSSDPGVQALPLRAH